MKTHFRFCPKHRLPLPCKHCAQIAAPSAAPPAPEPEPKRGRPRLHENDAARKQAHRDKERKTDKMKLIAAIVHRVKSYQSKPSNTAADVTAQEIFQNNREH